MELEKSLLGGVGRELLIESHDRKGLRQRLEMAPNELLESANRSSGSRDWISPCLPDLFHVPLTSIAALLPPSPTKRKTSGIPPMVYTMDPFEAEGSIERRLADAAEAQRQAGRAERPYCSAYGKRTLWRIVSKAGRLASH